MRERQDRQIELLRAIVRFFKQHRFTNARVLHLMEELLAHYARVRQLVEENSSAKAAPIIVRRGAYLTKDRLREEQLLPLSRRGRKLARAHPELLTALKVPHKNAPVDEIVDAAERIAHALRPHLNVLIEAKFPRNCLAVLRRDARALRADAAGRQESRALLGRSNRALTEELSLARQTINELDAVLRTLDNYRSVATDWNICNRMGARLGRPSRRRLAARQRSAARLRAREELKPRQAPVSVSSSSRIRRRPATARRTVT
jgi:hypothetical protein